MIDEHVSRSAVVSRSLKRPIVLFMIAAALLAMLAIAERDQGGTPLNGDDIAQTSPFDRFSRLFGTPFAARASAVQLPSAGGPTAAQAPLVAGVTTPAAAIGAAQATAQQALGQANQVAGSAVVAQQFPPFIEAIVCPILLQARATVVATINALIAAFPFLAPQLNAVLGSALATIDAQLARFGCGISP